MVTADGDFRIVVAVAIRTFRLGTGSSTHLPKSVLSISKKLESDPKTRQNQKPCYLRFFNSFTKENLRPHSGRTAPTGVYHQPGFGSNNVYQVVLSPQTTTSGINPTDDVLNNPVMVSSADDCGSGHTSKVDDISVNTSSPWPERWMI
uniref:(northern house mosquito) hypothetical protein n=1 Tax=Culex pipiens TaxID=7175 RepID=A0A8D8NK41_CULPI